MMRAAGDEGSTLTMEEYTYLLASDFLYYVFLMFDDEVDRYRSRSKDEATYNALGRRWNWWPVAHTLLEWALDEGLTWQSRQGGRLHDRVESTVGSALNEFMPTVQKDIVAAVKRQSGCLDWESDNRVPVFLYLYYCGWLFYVLKAFQEIHAQLTTTAPQLNARFDAIREEYRRLLEVLQGELQSIETIIGVDETTSAQVRADVEAVGKELAEAWRQVVYETTKQLLPEE